jgi:ketosteroid isomerase-like protein
MKRLLFIVVLTVATPALAWAQNDNAEREIRDLESQDLQTMVRGGASSFRERYVAEDFLETNPNGAVYTKAEVVAFAQSDSVRFGSVDVDDQKVRVYGDTAVVTGRAHIKGAAAREGRVIDSWVRYTRVWVKQGGSWKIVAFHVTRIAEPAPQAARAQP